MDSAPFNYGRQNAQHIAAASIHSYSKYIQNSGKLQWGGMDFMIHDSVRETTGNGYGRRRQRDVSIHASAKEAIE